jgi:hypothetical protein
MIKRRRKIILGIAVVILVLTGIWVVPMCIVPDVEVSAYKRSLIARGEKLEIADVLPPPVPPEQNGADIVNKAAKFISSQDNYFSNNPPAMRVIMPGKAIVGFEQPDVRSTGFSSAWSWRNYTNSWSNVMVMAETYLPATKPLKQMINFPALNFHVDYSNEWEMELTHLWSLDNCSGTLSSEAICDLHRGDTASATTNICALLALITGVRNERLVISQWDRMEMVSHATSATWELLQASNVNDVELAMLQSSWTRLEFIHAAENAILMDRASKESTIQKMQTSDEYFRDIANPFSSSPDDFADSAKLAFVRFMWRASWAYSEELQILQTDQAALETIRMAETNGFFEPAYTRIIKQPSTNKMNSTLDHWLDRLDMPDCFWALSEDRGTVLHTVGLIIAHETVRQIVVTAIALKRYELKYGNYPATLSKLVPQFLTTVPFDPIDGDPLHYQLKTNGSFTLYSVGYAPLENDASFLGKNWGSFYGETDFQTFDWVWPQPATPEEIQNFYAHPPK